MFADDTTLIIKGDSVDEVENLANLLLEKLMSWLYVNQWTVNFDKTNFIVFSKKTVKKNSCSDGWI